MGSQVTILNRTPERAKQLAAEFSQVNPKASLQGGPLTPGALAQARGAQLIVNTTPVGMWPNTQESPWPREVSFPQGVLLFDLIYNPRETRLMRQARGAGARAVDGLRMLVHQGAEAFELWTGQSPPVEVMYQACLAVLGGNGKNGKNGGNGGR